MSGTVRRSMLPTALALGLSLAAGLPALADFQETRNFDGDTLHVRNLIGEIKVVGGASRFEVAIHVQGRDADPGDVEIVTAGDRLDVRFPGTHKFVYPALGPGNRTSFSFDESDRGWLSAVLGGLTGSSRITVRGSGSGTEVWADLEIRVPDGGDLDVRLGVGRIHARGVRGDLVLDTNSGGVDAEDVTGTLTVDTGSGNVSVAEVNGAVTIDTGSGNVSGRGLRGGDVNVDTGSGSVELDEVETARLLVDTGSGSVRVAGLRTDSADVDTGSGGVTVLFERMGNGAYRFDTGSGGVTLEVPRDASLDVHAETGSGGIEMELDGAAVCHQERDEVAFSLNGGRARVEIDTGSGGVRIRHAD